MIFLFLFFTLLTQAFSFFFILKGIKALRKLYKKDSLKKLLIAAIVAAISSGALAAENNAFYLGVEAGYTRIDDTTQQNANTLVGALGGSATVTSDTGMALGKIFAGYQFTENFSAEIGAYRTSEFDEKGTGITGGGDAYTITAKTDVYGVEGSFLLRPNVSTGLNGLFGRFGGHWDKAETRYDLSAAGTAANGNRWNSGSGLLVGAGYDAEISKDVNARASWTYYDSVAGTDAYANVGSVAVILKF